MRKDEGFKLEPLLERWDRSEDLAVHGVGFLVYGLLDIVIDQTFATLDEFDEFYDDVSDSVFSEDTPIQPSQKLVRHAQVVDPAPPAGRADA